LANPRNCTRVSEFASSSVLACSNVNQRVEEQAYERPAALLLMTHPGVGPVTALATDVFLGDPARFADGKTLASYVGMIPSELISGES